MTTRAGRRILRWAPGIGCLAILLALSAPSARAQTGTIAGQVTDGRTATPVAGATIEIGESQLRRNERAPTVAIESTAYRSAHTRSARGASASG